MRARFSNTLIEIFLKAAMVDSLPMSSHTTRPKSETLEAETTLRVLL